MGIEDDGIEKGFHSYLFTDLDYAGNIVNKTFAKFDRWYRSWEGKDYVFEQQLHQYCEMDVCILRKCCLIFLKLID